MALLLKSAFNHTFLEQNVESIRELNFLSAVERYNLKHNELMRYTHPGYTFPERPSASARKELSKTFQEFLVDNDLSSLTAILQIAQAAQGYGYLTRVPAYYGLLWITPELLCGSAMYLLLAKLSPHEGLFKSARTYMGSSAYQFF